MGASRPLKWTTKESPRSWVAFFWADYCRVMGISLPSPARSPQLSAAVRVIRQLLWAGPRRQADVERHMAAAGISWRTAKSVKRLLHVESRRVGFGPGSHVTWALPDPPPDARLEPRPLPDRRFWPNAAHVTAKTATVGTRWVELARKHGEDPADLARKVMKAAGEKDQIVRVEGTEIQVRVIFDRGRLQAEPRKPPTRADMFILPDRHRRRRQRNFVPDFVPDCRIRADFSRPQASSRPVTDPS